MLTHDQRRADRRKQLLIAAAIIAPVLLIGALLTLGAYSRSRVEVTVTSCRVDGRMATVQYEVTNRASTTARSVRLRIEYRSGGARIDTDSATVRDIAPGETVRGEESTHLDVAPGRRGECLIKVD